MRRPVACGLEDGRNTFQLSCQGRSPSSSNSDSAPQGWTITAEETIVAGKGGSRVDVLLRGPEGVVEFDWKTTEASALSSKARNEMERHAGHIAVHVNGRLTQQQSSAGMTVRASAFRQRVSTLAAFRLTGLISDKWHYRK